jgi:Sushi repeat (SCR repeat)
LISTAVTCSPLKVANADLNTTDRFYKTSVNVSCQTGYQIAEDEYWIVIQCQADKMWSTQPTGCTGTEVEGCFFCFGAAHVTYITHPDNCE